MANWLDYFFGSKDAKVKSEPSLGLEKAEHGSFPSQQDARYALEQGYGYGSGFEPYIEGKRAHIYDYPATGPTSKVIATPSTNTDLTRFGSLSELGKINALHAQTALAVGRNPIASLGYDPHQINLQTRLGPDANLGGAYSPSQDRTWVNVEGSDVPSSAAHEAIHRGMHKLKETQPWMSPAELKNVEEAKYLMAELPGAPSQEDTVRYIMAKQLGDPELDAGEVDNEQRQRALNRFRQQSYYFAGTTGEKPIPEKYNIETKLRRLEELAAEARKNRRPGGPR